MTDSLSCASESCGCSSALRGVRIVHLFKRRAMIAVTMQILHQDKTPYVSNSPTSSDISSEGRNLKIKSHFIYIKINVSGDFPGSNGDLLVVAALNPLLHKFEYFKYFLDFMLFDDHLEVLVVLWGCFDCFWGFLFGWWVFFVWVGFFWLCLFVFPCNFLLHHVVLTSMPYFF